jgi:hypothetical protein
VRFLGTDQAGHRGAAQGFLGSGHGLRPRRACGVSRAAVRNVVITEGPSGGEDFTEANLAGEDFTADIPAVVEAHCERPRLHPYSKPPAVYEHVLRRVVRRGDMVLDPFAGSGRSRTACRNLDMGLRWSGCDIDPAYAETGPEGEPL